MYPAQSLVFQQPESIQANVDFFRDLTSKTAIPLLSENVGHKTPPSMPPVPGNKALFLGGNYKFI